MDRQQPTLGTRKESINVLIYAAAAGGELKAVDPTFAVYQLQAVIKTFALWPQSTIGQPPLSAEMRQQIVQSAVETFRAVWSSRLDSQDGQKV